MRVVNQPVPKVDYEALVTGKGVYTDDLAPADCLIVKVLRSPHAHALIKDTQVSRAEAVPGIECVLTYKDCPDKRFTMAGQTYPEPSPYDRLILDQRMIEREANAGGSEIEVSRPVRAMPDNEGHFAVGVGAAVMSGERGELPL